MSFFSSVSALPAVNYVNAAGEALNYAPGVASSGFNWAGVTEVAKSIMGVTGAVMQVAGTYSKYKAQEVQRNAARVMGEFNASQVEADIKALETKKAYDIKVQEEANRKLKSKQRIMLAKAGVKIDSGSPLLTRIYEEELMEREVDVMEYNANVGIEKLKNKQSYYRWSGGMMGKAFDVASDTTLLTGVGKLYNSASSKSYWDEV